MRRFWIDRSLKKNGEFLLAGNLYHHVCRVCRLEKGEVFELFAEGQQKYVVQLHSVSASRAKAIILEAHPVPLLKKPYIHLALSVPRLPKMDFILEKSVELGVKRIQPLFSEFSFVKKPDQITQNRRERWETLVRKACALSGRTEPLEISPPLPLESFFWPKPSLALMAFEGEQITSFKERLNQESGSPSKALWIFIGSEGGFSGKEATTFSKKGGKIFSLGNQILRVETACLMSLSVLKYHYNL